MNAKERLQLSESWRPRIYLEVRSGSDVLCALPAVEELFELEMEKDKQRDAAAIGLHYSISVKWQYPDKVHEQPVYFKAMSGEGWQAVLYCFYFRNDPKGMHLHDLTGVLRFVRREYEDIWVSRVHYRLIIEHRSGVAVRRVLLTAGDHTPNLDCGAYPSIDYGNTYPLIDLDTIDIEPYRRAFAPSVTPPDEWSCTRADAFLAKTPKGRELAKRFGIKTVRGLIVTAPEKLITVLESM